MLIQITAKKQLVTVKLTFFQSQAGRKGNRITIYEYGNPLLICA